MRPRVSLGIGLIALALVFLIYFVSHEDKTKPVPENVPGDSRKNSSRDNFLEPIVRPPEPVQRLTSSDSLAQPNVVETNSVEETILQLQEFGARSDAESFRMIVANLSNTNPEIRKAALEATIQFGSRDAIPVLKEVAAKTEDPREKVDILDAIEFLELPSLSEIRRSRRANPPKP